MTYKATIDLLLDVPGYGEACDAVGEMLRAHLRAHNPGSVLVDWRYQPSAAEEFGPVEVDAIPDDFNEDSPWPTEAGSL